MTERFDTVVIGAGQAGLATSYYLTQQGREHVILEKQRVGEAWRSAKWDTFTLVTPSWTLRLPGLPYNGSNPDGFLTRDDVVDYLEDYVKLFDPPIRLRVEVTAIEGRGDTFAIETKNNGTLVATNVVVAVSLFQNPRIPSFSSQIASHIYQIHSSHYRCPEALPSGAILVVGSGQSGCQIAEELHQHGRKVYLSTGRANRLPRCYRGKDIFWWAEKMGVLDQPVSKLPSPEARFAANPQLSGNSGGHSLNLHQFAQDGITLLGRLQDINGSRAVFADDLKANLAQADEFEAEFMKMIDEFIEETGIQAPEEILPQLRAGYDAETITDLDLNKAGIQTIIWASGYTFDFSWIKFPIFDTFGYPVQQRGVTAQPGLYFVGLHWLHVLKSSLLAGVGEDAEHVAAHLAARPATD